MIVKFVYKSLFLRSKYGCLGEEGNVYLKKKKVNIILFTFEYE